MYWFWLIVKIIACLLILWGMTRSIQKIIILRRIVRHIQTLPSFKQALIGCYVYFKGRIQTANQLQSPLTEQTCEFYRSTVVAHWSTKIKKPGKGVNEHKKILYQALSEVPLSLVNPQGEEVYIDIAAFYQGHGWVTLSTNEAKVKQCPALCRDRAMPKYRHYAQVEDYCMLGQRIEVYGLLGQTNDGRLWLKPTLLEAYPAAVCVDHDDLSILINHQQKLRREKKILIFLGILLLVMSGFFIR